MLTNSSKSLKCSICRISLYLLFLLTKPNTIFISPEALGGKPSVMKPSFPQCMRFDNEKYICHYLQLVKSPFRWLNVK